MTATTKFIVWDWNGTLQDDLPISIAVVNQNMKVLGKDSVSEEHYRECFDVPIERLYRNLGLSEDEIAKSLSGLEADYFAIYERMVVSTDFRRGAREILDFASTCGIRHVVLSNHLKPAVENDLRRLKKRDAFHDVLAWPDKETQFKHPKGDFLKAYMQRHALRPDNGIIVGDSLEEVRAGRELGLASVAISGGYTSLRILRDSKPDYLIHELPELKPILHERGLAA
jgi:phosphoglycolate phosphatase